MAQSHALEYFWIRGKWKLCPVPAPPAPNPEAVRIRKLAESMRKYGDLGRKTAEHLERIASGLEK